MILTDLSQTPLGHRIQIAPDATAADFFHAGQAEGERIGREFKKTYSVGAAADPSQFVPAVERALDEVAADLRKAGASTNKIAAFRRGFLAALDPHVKQWLTVQKLMISSNG